MMSNIPLDLALPKIIHEEMSKFGEVLRIKVYNTHTYIYFGSGKMGVIKWAKHTYPWCITHYTNRLTFYWSGI